MRSKVVYLVYPVYLDFLFVSCLCHDLRTKNSLLRFKYERTSKNLSNHRVVMRKWSLVICKGFFHMTTLWFDKFFKSVRKLDMETSRLSLKCALILLNFNFQTIGRLQLMHSVLVMYFFIKIYNHFCWISFLTFPIYRNSVFNQFWFLKMIIL